MIHRRILSPESALASRAQEESTFAPLTTLPQDNDMRIRTTLKSRIETQGSQEMLSTVLLTQKAYPMNTSAVFVSPSPF